MFCLSYVKPELRLSQQTDSVTSTLDDKIKEVIFTNALAFRCDGMTVEGAKSDVCS